MPWQVLASINRIETAFGTNLNVSSAGALGWMQFIPSSWQAYGVDANEDGRKDPYNPVDAICAAARYLKAAGAEEDLRDAIFAYNHADWYVDEVLLYANQYAKLPDDLIGSLTGLTEGAHFPVAANARYADDISEREALERSKTNRTAAGNAADVISDSPTRRGINIYSRVNAPVVAVNDGVITKMGENEKLGKFIVLQDAYGNRYTYAQLGEISDVHPVPKERALTAKDFKLVGPGKADGDRPDPRPGGAASAGANDAEPDAQPRENKADAPRQHRGAPPAPLRPARAPLQRRPRRRHRPARHPARQEGPRLRDLQELLLRRLQVRRRTMELRRCRRAPRSPAAPSSATSARPAPARRTSTSRSSPPAAAPPRSTRSRSSTAGSCWRRPRSTAPPARTRSAPRPPSARSC